MIVTRWYQRIRFALEVWFTPRVGFEVSLGRFDYGHLWGIQLALGTWRKSFMYSMERRRELL